MGTLADRIGTSFAREAVRLHNEDDSEAADELMLGPGPFVGVLDFVPVDEEDAPYVGLLKVEPH